MKKGTIVRVCKEREETYLGILTGYEVNGFVEVVNLDDFESSMVDKKFEVEVVIEDIYSLL